VAERAGPASGRLDLAAGLKPFLVCIASPADRWLAGLFLLTGAHMAVIGSSFLFIARQHLLLPEWGTAAILVQALAAIAGTGIAPGMLRRVAPCRCWAGSLCQSDAGTGCCPPCRWGRWPR
jgi:hypothetical protein